MTQVYTESAMRKRLIAHRSQPLAARRATGRPGLDHRAPRRGRSAILARFNLSYNSLAGKPSRGVWSAPQATEGIQSV